MERVAELVRARVTTGPLKRVELDLVCEACLATNLDSLRWIECADGSYTSLEQLRQEETVLYWPRDYFFKPGGTALLPILSTPLMLEVVTRACTRPPQLAPPPLLYREVPLPFSQGFGQALKSLANIVDRETGLLSGIRKLLKASPEPPAPPPEVGQALLASLRRRASQLLTGTARSECLQLLEAARLRPGIARLWEFQGTLLLRSDHPLLQPWLGHQEPPIPVQTSLLLSLVCASNALSQPFTDEMEKEFLEHISQEIWDSCFPSCIPAPSSVSA